jgi:nucleotide-binding universal stress UspA family protein
MYPRILVATDGSDISDRALQEFIMLANDQNAMLRTVHVVDETGLYGGVEFVDPSEVEGPWIQIAREMLNKALNSARWSGITVDAKLLETEKRGRGKSRCQRERGQNMASRPPCRGQSGQVA